MQDLADSFIIYMNEQLFEQRKKWITTMKKYLFILMAAIAFVACNDDEATPNNPGDNSQERTIKTVDETPAQVEAFFSDVNTAMWVNRKILGFTYRKNEIWLADRKSVV